MDVTPELKTDALSRHVFDKIPKEMTIEGTSMSPYLQKGDSVKIVPVDKNSLKPGRCYVYKNGEGLSIHRLVSITEGYAVFIGDNMLAPHCVPVCNIIGKPEKEEKKSLVKLIEKINDFFFSLFRIRRYIINRLIGRRRYADEKKI